jgi:hypothetical protein
MKAEHRKELQTNTLADNLGRMITGSRSMSRRTVLILVAIVVLGLGLFVWTMIQNNNVAMQAQMYYNLDQGSAQDIEEVYKAGPDTEPGKIAEFQLAWFYLWKLGIEPLANKDKAFDALRALKAAKETYAGLAEKVENDRVLAAEAQYALALIEETLAVTDASSADRAARLKRVAEQYRDVGQKYDQTAHGTQATARAEYLQKNHANVLAFYDQLASRNPLLSLIGQMPMQRGSLESEPREPKK